MQRYLSLHIIITTIIMALILVACSRTVQVLPDDDSEKDIWFTLHLATPERVLPQNRSIVINPSIIDKPDTDGINLENRINTVRLFVFDSAGNFVANIINANSDNLINDNTTPGKHITKLYFKLRKPNGSYRLVFVANEQMLSDEARLELLNFNGTLDQLKNAQSFMSIPLDQEKVGSSIIAFTGETSVFDVPGDGSHYITEHGRKYYQVNTVANPFKIKRICAKVELTITNHEKDPVTGTPKFIKPESAFFKLKTLRRIDIRNTTALFKPTSGHPESLLSSEVALTAPNMTGTNEIEEMFTFKDQFYAGEYDNGIGFGDGTILNTDRQTSSAFFLQLEDINGATYDYIIPIGDKITDAADHLVGMSMERNVIYRINIQIVGKHIKVFFIFRVAKENHEILDPIEIYPKN